MIRASEARLISINPRTVERLVRRAGREIIEAAEQGRMSCVIEVPGDAEPSVLGGLQHALVISGYEVSPYHHGDFLPSILVRWDSEQV